MKSRERARELARESSSTGAAGLDVSPPAGRAQRVAHCGTTRFLILRGGHFRELCLPPPPPPPHRLGPQRSFPCASLKFFSLWRLLAQDLDPPSKMATVFTQAASTLKLNLHAPKPASRFDDLSFDPMDASPLPARGLAAAGCVQAMPPRRSTSSARAPLVCASPRRSHTSPPRPRSAQARHKSDPHRPPKARRPQRRGRLHRLQARRPLRRPVRYRVLLRDHPDIVFAKGSNLLVDTCAPCAARRFTRAPAAQ